jgi:hypothetical protein
VNRVPFLLFVEKRFPPVKGAICIGDSNNQSWSLQAYVNDMKKLYQMPSDHRWEEKSENAGMKQVNQLSKCCFTSHHL